MPKKAAAPNATLEREIKLHKPNTQKFKVTIGGNMLLMNRFSEEQADDMESKQRGEPGAKAKQKSPRDPLKEFHRGRHLDAKGRDCFPAIAIKKAMLSVAPTLNIPKTRIRQTIFIEADLIPIKYEGKGPMMRRDRVVLAGIRRPTSLAYRPQYNDWQAEFVISFNADVWTMDEVVHLLAHAGFSNGIGSWRPEKDGQHGRFVVLPPKAA